MITFSFRSLSFNPPLSSPRRLYLCLETSDGASQNSEPFMYSPQTNIASLSEILEFFLKESQKKGSFQLEIMEFDEMPQRWFRIAKETFALNKLKTNNEPSVLSMPTIYGTTAIVGLRIELAEEIRGSMLEEDMESLLGDTLLPDDASPAVDQETPKKGSKRQRLQKWLKLDKVEIFKTASMYYDIVYALTPFVEAKQQLIDFFTWKNPQTTWMYSIVLTLIMIYGRYLLAIGLILFAIFGNKAIPYVMKSRPRADKVHGKLRIYKKNFGFVRQLVKDIVFGYDLYRRAADDPNKVVFLLILHYTKILAPFLALILFIFDLRTLVLAGYWSFLFFNTTKGRELTINMLLQSYHILVRYKMIPLRVQASLKRLVEYQKLVQETLKKEGVIKDLQKEAAQKEAAIAEIQKEAAQKEAATLQAAAMQIATTVKNEQKETVPKEASVLPAVVMQAAAAVVKNEQKETVPEEAAALPAVAMQAAASLTTLLKEPSSRENLLKSPQSAASTKPTLTSLGELISTPEQNKNKKQIEKTVTIYENQRWWIGIGWTPDLLPGERPSWSDELGKEMHKDKARLPGAGWNWRGDWMYVLSPKTDTQGWEYASRFSKFDDPDRKKSLVHSVRRRTWIRKCVGFDD